MKKLISTLIILTLAVFAVANTAVQTVSATDAIKPTASEHILKCLENMETEINLSPYNIPLAQLPAIYNGIVNENPQLFYLGRSYSYTYKNHTVLAVKPEYTGSKQDILHKKIIFEEEINKALAAIPKGVSDMEKVLAVNDYIVNIASYDKSLSKLTAYDLFVDKTAVCEGYCAAFGILMDRLGIESRLITSPKMKHSWNMVKLKGNWYHVDVTWNDPTPDILGRVSHKFLLLSDSVIKDAEHGHYGWDADSPKAVDDSFKNSFWTDINTSIIYYNGLWHAAYSSDGLTHHIMAVDFASGETSNVHKVTAQWKSGKNSHWFWGPYIAAYGEHLYYNTADAIYKIGFDGTGNTVVLSESLGGTYAIYEMSITDGFLHYRIRSSPETEGEEKAISLK